ncbi:MAG: ATP-binding protein [Pseudomonadales bacterium]|nr:ATP-binding protein [Pseudomonadales bacterium]
MDQNLAGLNSLFLISISLSALFFLAWRGLERTPHALTWSFCYLASAIHWLIQILTEYEILSWDISWVALNLAGLMSPLFGVVGFRQRAELPKLPLYKYTGIVGIPFAVIIASTYFVPIAGLQTATLPMFGAITSLWAIVILNHPARKKRLIERAMIVVSGVMAFSSIVLASLAFSQGISGQAGPDQLYLESQLIVFPAILNIIGVLGLLIIGSDLAAKTIRLSERSTQRSKEVLQDTIDAMPDLVMISDSKGNFLTCNTAFAKALGTRRSKLAFKSQSELMSRFSAISQSIDGEPVKSAEDIQRALLNALQDESQFNLVTRDDRSFMVGCGYLSSGDQIAIAREVTQLHKATHRLETAIQSMPIGFALFDKQNQLIASNSSYEKLLRKDRSWIRQQSFETLIATGVSRIDSSEATDAVQSGHAELEDAVRNRKVFNRTARFDDGSWYDITVQPVVGEGFVTIARDITKRRLLEINLENSEAQLREVLDSQPFPVIVVRANDQQPLFVSKAAARLLEIDEGLDIATFKFDLKQASTSGDVVTALVDRGDIALTEMLISNSSGRDLPVLLSAHTTEFGGEQARVISFIDISDMKQMQQEIAEQQQALYHSEKLNMIGSLMAGIAHDLNNPLTSAIGNAQMMSRSITDPELSKRLDNIKEAADRCKKIVQSFLSMARTGSAERVPCNIGDCIEQAVEVSNFGIHLPSADISVDVAPNLPVVLGEPDQLIQVITNLIINAKQAMENTPPPRTIAISAATSSDDHHVLLDVKDNGPGVPDEDAEKIFEPFFTTKAEGKGTGMGLSLVNSILKSHGGSIRLMQNEEPGCHIQIKLPCHMESES